MRTWYNFIPEWGLIYCVFHIIKCVSVECYEQGHFWCTLYRNWISYYWWPVNVGLIWSRCDLEERSIGWIGAFLRVKFYSFSLFPSSYAHHNTVMQLSANPHMPKWEGVGGWEDVGRSLNEVGGVEEVSSLVNLCLLFVITQTMIWN